MSLLDEFRYDLGEAVKRRYYVDFENKWGTIIDRLENKASPKLKTMFDPWNCPRCGYRIR